MPVKKRGTAGMNTMGEEAAGDEDALSDSDAPVDEYDSDLYGDDDDKARLYAMGELEREQVLYERSQVRQEKQEARRLKRDARARRLGQRVSTRAAAPAAVAGKSAKAAALDQIREARSRQGADRAKAASARATAALERTLGGDDEDGDYSDGEDHRGRRSGRGRRGRRDASVSDDERMESEDEDDVQLAGFADILGCCVTRTQMEKWIDKPFFDDTLSGCFVRVGTGVGGDGQAVYRMARIVAVVSGVNPVTGQEMRPYEFGKPAGRRTPKWLLLQHGDQQRVFKMSMVSNAAPQEREFAGWARGEMDSGRKPLRLSDVTARRAAIARADAYRWASADVAAVIAQKKATRGGPRNVALEKEQLVARLQVAEQEGDEHTALDCRVALEALEEEIERTLPRGAAALTSINKRNAAVNIQLVDESYTAKEASKAAAAGTGANDVDPFSRRPTRVTNYWQTKSKEQQASEAEAAAAVAAAAASQASQEVAAPVEAPPGEAPDPRLVAAAWPPEHPQAAEHRQQWRPLDMGRLAAPRALSAALAGWTGGQGAAEAAISSGMTLITLGEYKKRLIDAQRVQQQQQQQQQGYYQQPTLPPPPPQQMAYAQQYPPAPPVHSSQWY